MKTKRIILLLTTFLLPFAFSPIVKAETHLIWSFDWEGMDVEVYAPYQAYPGDTITIRVRVEAKEDLQDVYVTVWLYGSKSEGYGTWTKIIGVLDDVDLSTGVVRDQNFDVDIPSDVSPGLIYSHTYCNWKVWRWLSWQDRSLDDSFRVIYLKNKAYEDLQLAYNDLLNDYNTLLADYSDLLDDYDALNSTYHSLLAEHNELQANYTDLGNEYIFLNASYYELLENYTTVVSERDYWKSECNDKVVEYNSLQADHTDLQDNYNSLQTSYGSLQSSHNTLQTTYNSLNSTYNTLQSEYDSLKSKDEALTADLGSTRNLSYIFIITTVVFIVTTAYFAVRKPKVKAS